LVQADHPCNYIVFVWKAHYYNCILNEIGINSTFGNPFYTPTALSKDENRSDLDTFNIPINGMSEYELSNLYWNPKLKKNIYKHRYIAGLRSAPPSLYPCFPPTS
jgi:hypothetical protein